MRRSLGPGFFLKNMSITTKLIIAEVIFFVLAGILGLFIPNFIDYIALKPGMIVQGKYLWTLVTSMFMHAGFMHLFFNMLSLWFVGRFAENIIGRKRFLYFYLISGIIAGIVFALLAGFFGGGDLGRLFGSPDISGVGASGAIFGIVGVVSVLTPFNRVYLIAGPLIAIVIQVIAESFFGNGALISLLGIAVSIYIFISIFSMLSFNRRTARIAVPIEMDFWLLPVIAIVPLVVIGLFVPLPIGNTAHFGGLLAGLIYGYYLRKKYRKKVKMLDSIYRRQ